MPLTIDSQSSDNRETLWLPPIPGLCNSDVEVFRDTFRVFLVPVFRL